MNSILARLGIDQPADTETPAQQPSSGPERNSILDRLGIDTPEVPATTPATTPATAPVTQSVTQPEPVVTDPETEPTEGESSWWDQVNRDPLNELITNTEGGDEFAKYGRRSLVRGASMAEQSIGGTAQTIGTAMRRLNQGRQESYIPGPAELAAFGGSVLEAGGKWAAEDAEKRLKDPAYKKSKDWKLYDSTKGDFTDPNAWDPMILLEPMFYVDFGVEQATMMLPFMVATAMGRIPASVLVNVVMEGGRVFREAKLAGATDDQALADAGLVALAQIPVTILTQLPASLIRSTNAPALISKFLVDTFGEGFEEYFQSIASQSAEKLTYNPDKVIDHGAALEEAALVLPIAGSSQAISSAVSRGDAQAAETTGNELIDRILKGEGDDVDFQRAKEALEQKNEEKRQQQEQEQADRDTDTGPEGKVLEQDEQEWSSFDDGTQVTFIDTKAREEKTSEHDGRKFAVYGPDGVLIANDLEPGDVKQHLPESASTHILSALSDDALIAAAEGADGFGAPISIFSPEEQEIWREAGAVQTDENGNEVVLADAIFAERGKRFEEQAKNRKEEAEEAQKEADREAQKANVDAMVDLAKMVADDPEIIETLDDEAVTSLAKQVGLLTEGRSREQLISDIQAAVKGEVIDIDSDESSGGRGGPEEVTSLADAIRALGGINTQRKGEMTEEESASAGKESGKAGDLYRQGIYVKDTSKMDADEMAAAILETYPHIANEIPRTGGEALGSDLLSAIADREGLFRRNNKKTQDAQVDEHYEEERRKINAEIDQLFEEFDQTDDLDRKREINARVNELQDSLEEPEAGEDRDDDEDPIFALQGELRAFMGNDELTVERIEHEELEEMGEELGLEVVPVEPSVSIPVSGQINKNNPHQIVVNASKPADIARGVTLHEALHSLKILHPELWQNLHDFVSANAAELFEARGLIEYKRSIGVSQAQAVMADNAVEYERLADLLKDLNSDNKLAQDEALAQLTEQLSPHIWNELAKENPTLVQRILEIINKIIARIKGIEIGKPGREGVVRGKLASQALASAEAIADALRTAAATNKETGPSAGTTDGDTLYGMAHHGGPHNIPGEEGFSTDKIGTGEGEKAYGWGLYFASLKEVADSYKKDLAEKSRSGQGKVNGIPVQEFIDSLTPDEARMFSVRWSDYEEGLSRQITDFEPEEDMAESMKENLVDEEQWRYPEDDGPFDLEAAKSVASKIQTLTAIPSPGYGYTVDLQPEEDEYLLWDVPIRKQSQKVQDALRDTSAVRVLNVYGDLEKLSDDSTIWMYKGHTIYIKRAPTYSYHISGPTTDIANDYANLEEAMAKIDEAPFDDNPKGMTIYNMLEREHGSDKAASMYLKSLGVRGIKYLDGGSRNQRYGDKWTVQANNGNTYPFDTQEEAEAAAAKWNGPDYPNTTATVHAPDGTYNYVLFDGADAEIKSRWAIAPDLESDEFKNWFKQSKAVDRQGNPLRLYHASDEKRTVFKNIVDDRGMNLIPGALFFASDKAETGPYGEEVTEAYMSIQNPFIVDYSTDEGDANGEWLEDQEGDVIALLKARGFDGAFFTGSYMDEWVAFDSTQIKSVDNQGTFDPENPDIRFAIAPDLESDEFKNWFKQSKAVDRQGNPLRLYHASDEKRTVFKNIVDDRGMNLIPGALFFASDKAETGPYGEEVTEAYMSIQNPFIVDYSTDEGDANGEWLEDQEGDVIALLKARGFDGAFFTGSYMDEWVAFDSTQIKSVDNQGTFDPENPDIRYAIEATAKIPMEEFLAESTVQESVFHGTRKSEEFQQFNGRNLIAGWFTPVEDRAKRYSQQDFTLPVKLKDGQLLEVNINLKNPLVIPFDANDRKTRDQMREVPGLENIIQGRDNVVMHAYHYLLDSDVIAALEKAGYDGISITEEGDQTYAVFSALNIKATNLEEVDPSDARFRYAIDESNRDLVDQYRHLEKQIHIVPPADAAILRKAIAAIAQKLKEAGVTPGDLYGDTQWAIAPDETRHVKKMSDLTSALHQRQGEMTGNAVRGILRDGELFLGDAWNWLHGNILKELEKKGLEFDRDNPDWHELVLWKEDGKIVFESKKGGGEQDEINTEEARKALPEFLKGLTAVEQIDGAFKELTGEDDSQTLYAISPREKKAKAKEVNRLKAIVRSVIYTKSDAPRDPDVGIVIEPKAGNNQSNIERVDPLLELHPNPLESAEAWKAFTNDMAGVQIEPPHKMLEYIADPEKYWEERNNFNPRGLDRAEHGLEHISTVREKWTDGSISRETSDRTLPMIVLWNQLSAQISPFQHEGGFLDLVHHGVTDWIEASSQGVFDEAEYKKWYQGVVAQEQGNGPGTTYTKNNSISLNFPNFLKFLQMEAQEGPHAGKGMLEAMYDMMIDPEMTGQRFRREFLAARGTQKVKPGIDTKLLTFMLLGQGFTDLIVWDRVNVNGYWDTKNRAEQYQLPIMKDGTRSTNLYDWGDMTKVFGMHRGLAVSEALERAVDETLIPMYNAGTGSLARVHWENWNHLSGQDADHATLVVLQDLMAGVDPQEAIDGVFTRQGKFGPQYGVKYGYVGGKAIQMVEGPVEGDGTKTYYFPTYKEVTKYANRVTATFPKGTKLAELKYPFNEHPNYDREAHRAALGKTTGAAPREVRDLATDTDARSRAGQRLVSRSRKRNTQDPRTPTRRRGSSRYAIHQAPARREMLEIMETREEVQALEYMRDGNEITVRVQDSSGAERTINLNETAPSIRALQPHVPMVYFGDTGKKTFVSGMQDRRVGKLHAATETHPKTKKVRSLPLPTAHSLKSVEWWVLDNGAWGNRNGTDWSYTAFQESLEKLYDRYDESSEDRLPDFVVLPDRPFRGKESMEYAHKFADLMDKYSLLRFYMAVQENMPEAQVQAIVDQYPRIDGIFLGGGNAMKGNMGQRWADFAHENNMPLHYARAGTVRKLAHAIEIGADSIDSTSPIRTQDQHDEFMAALDRGMQASVEGKTPHEIANEVRGVPQLFAIEPDFEPNFYSALSRAVEDVDFKAMPAEDLLNRIKKTQGIKAEELAETRFETFLASNDRVTKEEVMEFLAENQTRIEVRERRADAPKKPWPGMEQTSENRWVVSGYEGMGYIERLTGNGMYVARSNSGLRGRPTDDFAVSETEMRNWWSNSGKDTDTRSLPKFGPGGSWVLRGVKEDYREMLVLAPTKPRSTEGWTTQIYGSAFQGINDYEVFDAEGKSIGRFPGFETEQEAIDHAAAYDASAPERRQEREFTGKHYPDDPNLVVHIRFDVRKDSNGKRSLFLEEVQSDWHQKARDIRKREIKQRIANGMEKEEAQRSVPSDFGYRGRGRVDTEVVADGPFKKTWEELGFKHALDYAVQNGLNSITWTTGQQQADRYDLRKHIDSIEYEQMSELDGTWILEATKDGENVIAEEGLTIEEVEDMVGKEIAQMMVDGEGDVLPDRPLRPDLRQFTGEDLAVGGRGMLGFYDDMIPRIVTKYIKKLDKLHPGITVMEMGGHTTDMGASADPEAEEWLTTDNAERIAELTDILLERYGGLPEGVEMEGWVRDKADRGIERGWEVVNQRGETQTDGEGRSFYDDPSDAEGIANTMMMEDGQDAELLTVRETEKGPTQQLGIEITPRLREIVKGGQALFAVEPDHSPEFHSALTAEVQKMDFRQMPATDLLNRIRKAKGIKPEELEFTRFDEWLEVNSALGKRVSKAEVLKFLEENQVSVNVVLKSEEHGMTRAVTWDEAAMDLGLNPEERHLFDATEHNDVTEHMGNLNDGTADPQQLEGMAGGTKYHDHANLQIGGRAEGSYREMLLQMPMGGTSRMAEIDEELKTIFASYEFVEDYAKATVLDRQVTALREERDKLQYGDTFTHGHWNEANVLAHVRFNDRTDENGDKVLFIEEAQSDWHQKGRKKGYGSKEHVQYDSYEEMPTEDLRNLLEWNDGDGEFAGFTREGMLDLIHSEDTSYDDNGWLLRQWNTNGGTIYAANTDWNTGTPINKPGVPEAPFKKSWPEMVFKHVLAYANKHGHRSIAWTTGMQQIERYESATRQAVDQIYVQPLMAPRDNEYNVSAMKGDQQVFGETMTAEKMEETIGKAMTEKALANLEEMDPSNPYRQTVLEGDDLTIGGEALKNFYDKEIPRAFAKYAKRLDRNHPGLRVFKMPMKGGVVWLGHPLSRNAASESSNYGVYDGQGILWEDFKTREEAEEYLEKQIASGLSIVPIHQKQTSEQLSLEITPALSEAVSRGQSLFAIEPVFSKKDLIGAARRHSTEGLRGILFADGRLFVEDAGVVIHADIIGEIGEEFDDAWAPIIIHVNSETQQLEYYNSGEAEFYASYKQDLLTDKQIVAAMAHLGAENDSGTRWGKFKGTGRSLRAIDDTRILGFHGRGGFPTFDKNRPVFMGERMQDVRFYAENVSKGHPTITAYRANIENPADWDALQEVFTDYGEEVGHGVMEDESGRNNPARGIWTENPLDHLYNPEIIRRLREEGYDGYRGEDMLINGYINVVVAFDPTVLDHVRTMRVDDDGQYLSEEEMDDYDKDPNILFAIDSPRAEILHAIEPDHTPKFFSAIVRAVEGMDFKSIPPKSLRNQIKRLPDIKDEEFAESRFGEWLDTQKGKVTKDEVLKFLHGHQMRIVITTKGNPEGRLFEINSRQGPIYEDFDTRAEAEERVRELTAEVNNGDREDNQFWVEDDTEYGDAENTKYDTWVLPGAEEGSYFELLMTPGERVVLEVGQRVRTEDGTTGVIEKVNRPGSDKKPYVVKHDGGDRLTLFYHTNQVKPIADDFQFRIDNMSREELDAWIIEGTGEPPTNHDPDMTTEEVRAWVRELAEEWVADAEMDNAAHTIPDEFQDLSDWENEEVYEGVHFEENNVIVHARGNRRFDSDGKKVLFLEEIQSDWHQAGRDEGYAISYKERARVMARQQEIRDQLPPLPTDSTELRATRYKTDREKVREHLPHLYDEFVANNGLIYEEDGPGVPHGPYEESWELLGLKGALDYAVEHGYERISWTTGLQQVNRYTSALRTQVDKLSWVKEDLGDGMETQVNAWKEGNGVFSGVYHADGSVAPNSVTVQHGQPGKLATADLSQVIGKTMADKILSSTEDSEITGADLTVGGEGMKSFYDSRLPKMAGKYLKKLDKNHPGVKVTTIPGIPTKKIETTHGGPMLGGQGPATMAFLDEGVEVETDVEPPTGLLRDLPTTTYSYDGEIEGYWLLEDETTHPIFWVIDGANGIEATEEFNTREEAQAWIDREAREQRAAGNDPYNDFVIKNTTSEWSAWYSGDLLVGNLSNRETAEEGANVHWNNSLFLTAITAPSSIDSQRTEATKIEDQSQQLYADITPAVAEKVRSGQALYAIDPEIRAEAMAETQLLYAVDENGNEVGDKPRSLPISLEEAGRPGGDDLTYTPISNEESVAAARSRIQENPDAAMRWVFEQYDVDAGTSETTATSLGLISHFQNEARKRTGRDRDEFYQKAIDIATRASKRLTSAGQEVQAASIISRLSPEGVQLMAQKKINQINETLPARKPSKEFTPEMAANFVKLGEEAQKWGILTDEAKRMAAITQKVNKGEVLTGADIQVLKKFVGKMRDIMGETLIPAGQGKTKRKKGVTGWAKVLTSKLSARESKADALLKEGGWLKAFWSKDQLPPEVMEAFADKGAALMNRLGHKRYTDWSVGMLEQMGEQSKPFLTEIYKASKEVLQKESSASRKVATQANRIQELVDLWEESADHLTAEMDEETSKTIAQMVGRVKMMTGDAQVEAAQDVQMALNMLEEPTFWRRVATAQTIAHLLNPKTNVRNIVGNELFFRLERMNKYLATPVDWTRSMLTGSDRTVTFRKGGQGGYWKALMKGMSYGWAGKTPGNLATQFDLEMKGAQFRGKYNPLTYMEKAMGATLRGFDYAAYTRAKNQVLGEMAVLAALNSGQKPTQQFVEDFIKTADERAVAIADEYGRYVTFQDTNLLSKSFSEAKKLLNFHQDFGFGDLVLKYPKTPANLLARSIEYSPIGVIRSMYILAEPYRTMKPSQRSVSPNPREVTLALTRAMVGSGIMALGVKLVLEGVLTAEEDEDWDVNTFRSEQTGERSYQVNLSAIGRWVTSNFSDSALRKRKGDTLYSYDWMQPIAISLGIGGQIGQGIREGEISATDILQAIPSAVATGTETIFQQPLLQGIRELMGGRKILDSVGKVVAGMPSSFVPTFLNQLRQYTGDNKARISYDPNPLQKALNRGIYKLPYFYKALPMAFKMMGEDAPREVYQNGNNSFWNVFFNPGFVATYQVNEQALALIAPYDEELRKRQFPRRPYQPGYKMEFSSKRFQRKFGVAKLTAKLDPEDISKLQRIAANFTSKEIAKKTRKDLTKMSPEEQEKWLADGVNDAYAKSREWFLDNMAQKYIDKGDAK